MQDPRRAADELRRAMTSLGLRGAQIGSNVNNRNLDDPALEPVWAVANELSAFFLIHPHGEIVPGDRLKSYYMRNFVGLPFETTIAGASLVFGGVLERYPNIAFCLCHGGGYVPYQAGRFVHAWQVRSEPKARLKETAPERRSRASTTTRSRIRRARWNSSSTRSGPITCCSAATIRSTWATSTASPQVRAISASAEVQDSVLGRRAMELLRKADASGTRA